MRMYTSPNVTAPFGLQQYKMLGFAAACLLVLVVELSTLVLKHENENH